MNRRRHPLRVIGGGKDANGRRPPGIAPDAAHAAAWGDAPPRSSLRLGSFHRMWKSSGETGTTLVGWLSSVTWPAAGLELLNVPVFLTDGRPWVGLPSAPVLDGSGRQRWANGKRRYKPTIIWTDRARGQRFSELVIELLEQRYPAALDAPSGSDVDDSR